MVSLYEDLLPFPTSVVRIERLVDLTSLKPIPQTGESQTKVSRNGLGSP